MWAFVKHIQEPADDDDVNAEGDNVLAAADLRASEKKAAVLLQQMEEIGE